MHVRGYMKNETIGLRSESVRFDILIRLLVKQKLTVIDLK